MKYDYKFIGFDLSCKQFDEFFEFNVDEIEFVQEELRGDKKVPVFHLYNGVKAIAIKSVEELENEELHNYVLDIIKSKLR
jgi:hypothetical protein